MAPREDRIARLLADLRPAVSVPARDGRARTLAQRMADCATPGASIGVVDDFEVAWVRGFGVRTMGSAAAVTADTLFQAGSIAKPVFALAVMRLVEDGTLDLDVDVNHYLTSWRVPDNGRWQPCITLRQLLSHTAGTTVHGFRGYPRSGPWPTALQVLQGAPPANTPEVVVDLLPGLSFRYSGGGTTIAQQVVVDVVRRPFPELMRDLILDPVGMAESTFEQPLPEAMSPRAADGHPLNGQILAGGWHVYPEMAAAGLWTTTNDLVRLARELMRSLRGEKTTVPLRAETISAMLRPQLPGQAVGEHFISLGWFCDGEGVDFCFGHQGVGEGFIAEMKVFPGRGQAAAVMINAHGWLLPAEIFDAIGRDYRWPATSSRAPLVEMARDVTFAGSYRSESGIVVEVIGSGDRLVLQFGDQTPVQLHPSSDTEFHATVVNLYVQFEISRKRVVTAMTLIQDDTTIWLKRDR